jgi:hypothetical protein
MDNIGAVLDFQEFIQLRQQLLSLLVHRAVPSHTSVWAISRPGFRSFASEVCAVYFNIPAEQLV